MNIDHNFIKSDSMDDGVIVLLGTTDTYVRYPGIVYVSLNNNRGKWSFNQQDRDPPIDMPAAYTWIISFVSPHFNNLWVSLIIHNVIKYTFLYT